MSLWRFSFATTSSLDALFTRETPPSLEEILDEQDILNEVKAQNNKLVSYLSNKDHIKSLLQWVVAGLDELDQAAEAADSASFQYALKSPSFFPAAVPPPGPGSPPLEPAKLADDDVEDVAGPESPGAPEVPAGLGQGLGTPKGEDTAQRSRYSLIATEILTADLWTVPETIVHNQDSLLRPFWDTVLPPIQPSTPSTEDSMSRSRHEQTEKERARDEFWSEEDEERHRKQEAIRGMWTRINGNLLQKRPSEMISFIRSLPNILDRMFAHIESPSVQDMIVRIVSAEEAGVTGVIDWLSSEELIGRLVALLSPEYPPATHLIASELIKSIITLCAPTPFNPAGGNAMEQAGQTQPGMRDNRLVRELASEVTISTLTGFMLDDIELTDKDWKGLREDGPCPADIFVTHPLPSLASASSSLTQICSILVELIRRNNSDFSEPHLFHTMRNRLMTIRMQRGTPQPHEEEEERSNMEDAMEEMSEKMGIVHLGNLLAVICRRFPDLHGILLQPKSQARAASALHPKPLTNERFRIIELYAELLHSSNMASLNRPPGTGPTYSTEGVLSGGLDSLEALGEAIDGDRAGEDEPISENQVTKARELPVSTGSTDASMSDVSEDDVSLEELDDITPSQSPTASRTLDPPELNPPPPSQADVARLRDVMTSESRPSPSESSDVASVSHMAQAATTAAPSIASDSVADAKPAQETGDEKLTPGDKLKKKYLEYQVIPTVVDLFFEHPHNDFSHHVIYDILQQVLNGRLIPSLNRDLAIQLIKEARLLERVMDAYRVNDRLAAQPKTPRLPYMGHVSLIAEELVKFLIRCPPDLWEILHDSVMLSEWEAFVHGSLRETKDRDTRPLAGGKPMPSTSAGAKDQSEDDSSDEEDEGGALGMHKFGEPLTRTSAQDGFAHRGDGFDSYEDRQESGDEDDDAQGDWYRRTGLDPNRRHVDSSDEDDEDVDWMRPGHDDFAAFQGGTSGPDDFDDADAWGDFAAASPTTGDTSNPFDDFAPEASSSSSRSSSTERAAPPAQLEPGPPLTPHDWKLQFEREFSDENWPGENAESKQAATQDVSPSILMPNADDDDEKDERSTMAPGGTWTFAGDDIGEDLPPTTSPITEDVPKLQSQPQPQPPQQTKSTAPDVPAASKAISALSLAAPKDLSLAGQSRRAPPPPPPSRAKPITDQPSPLKTDPTSLGTAASPTSTSPTTNTHPIPMRSPAPTPIDIPNSAISPVSSKSSSPISPIRRRYSHGASAFSPPESSLLNATSEEAPFGPGVSPDAHLTPGGMMQRKVNGKVVTVPADEVVLGVEEAQGRVVRANSFGSSSGGSSLGSSGGSQSHGRKRSHNWGGRQRSDGGDMGSQ